jgi:hypothetical protein
LSALAPGRLAPRAFDPKFSPDRLNTY